MSAKKIKAARRSATRIEAIRPVPVAPKGWPLLTIRVLATLGLSIGTYLTVLHYQAGTSGTIDSPFCGVGTLVNCSAVLGSAYARILSLPVALIICDVNGLKPGAPLLPHSVWHELQSPLV